MIILIPVIAVIVIAVFFAKRYYLKRLQSDYEKSLLRGDRKKSDQLGKMYYLSLNEATRKAKGIIDIEARISADFRSFNERTFCLMF